MLNTIRADFYRLFHSKGFYITQFLLIFFVALSIIFEVVGSMGVRSGETSQVQTVASQSLWSGIESVMIFSNMASFLLYFCLPLFVMTLGFDLSRKTLKNLLTSGVSRISFFLSKYLVFLVMVFFQFIFFYGTVFICASIKNGVGQFSRHYFENFLRTFGIQFLCIQGIFALALLVLYLSFSNVSAVITALIFPLVFSIITFVFEKIQWISYFDFQANIDTAWINQFPDGYWLKVTLSTLIFIFIACGISFIVFKKRDL